MKKLGNDVTAAPVPHFDDEPELIPCEQPLSPAEWQALMADADQSLIDL